ncbi:MAG: hypothetical protein M3Y56_10795 [Armatimonadota bacterium]|nr:hypothetical protein [Armatimonadota bacterium]
MIDGPYFETMGGVLKAGTTHVLALDTESHATLLGSDGPIWLYYLPDPKERQDLAGTWTGYSDSLHKMGDFQLPGNGKGMILSRTVVIDPAHAARNVVVYVEAAGDIFSLMINGQLILHGPQVREHITVYNITPMVKFGQENLIELLGHPGPQDKPVQTVEIRYYEKGVYP